VFFHSTSFQPRPSHHCRFPAHTNLRTTLRGDGDGDGDGDQGNTKTQEKKRRNDHHRPRVRWRSAGAPGWGPRLPP